MIHAVEQKMKTRTTLTARRGRCGCGLRDQIEAGLLPSDTLHEPNADGQPACPKIIWAETEDVLLDQIS